MPTDTPFRILVVAAHPDDIDFGAAGTIATWCESGSEVAYLLVTDGDAGGFEFDVARSEMAGIRREEQTAAAAVLGVHDLTFLGYPDGRLVCDFSLRKDISRVIRTFKPDRVLCPSPERDLSRIPASHPDHLAAGEAALCAVYPDARNPFAFPELLEEEGLEAHIVHELWIMAGPSEDTYVDTTKHIDKKITALSCHKSQLPDPEGTFLRVREWGSAIAARAGLPAGSYAEGFRAISIA